MTKKLTILSLLMIMFLISGCALSDYLTGNIVADTTILEEDSEDELDSIIEELEEEIADLESEVEITEEDIFEEVEIDEELEEDIDEESEEVFVEGDIDEDLTDKDFIKINVKENEKVRLKPKATDADEDTIIYTFTEPLNENGEWKTNYGDAGNYLITVSASDSLLTTSKKVLLIVERVNVQPVIEDIGSEIVVSEGDILRISPTVTDPNGDRVSYTLSDPIGNDGVWAIGYTDRGSYDLEIIATDGELDTIKEVTIIVNAKNVAPVIESFGDITIQEGDAIEIEPIVSDANEDDITITISDPIGDDGAWETDYTDHGVYEIEVSASDGIATTIETFTLIVVDVNKAPEIIDIIQEG